MLWYLLLLEENEEKCGGWETWWVLFALNVSDRDTKRGELWRRECSHERLNTSQVFVGHGHDVCVYFILNDNDMNMNDVKGQRVRGQDTLCVEARTLLIRCFVLLLLLILWLSVLRLVTAHQLHYSIRDVATHKTADSQKKKRLLWRWREWPRDTVSDAAHSTWWRHSSVKVGLIRYLRWIWTPGVRGGVVSEEARQFPRTPRTCASENTSLSREICTYYSIYKLCTRSATTSFVCSSKSFVDISLAHIWLKVSKRCWFLQLVEHWQVGVLGMKSWVAFVWISCYLTSTHLLPITPELELKYQS